MEKVGVFEREPDDKQRWKKTNNNNDDQNILDNQDPTEGNWFWTI